MKRFLFTCIMVGLLFIGTSISHAQTYSSMDLRPDGVSGYQWYEDAWTQLELKGFKVDKKGTCTAMTLFDPMRGLTLTFDWQITKDKLPKYKLAGNKFFYNYQTDWIQIESKKGDIIYTDVPVDPTNGELYNIETNY